MYLMVWCCTRVRNESKKKKELKLFRKLIIYVAFHDTSSSTSTFDICSIEPHM